METVYVKLTDEQKEAFVDIVELYYEALIGGDYYLPVHLSSSLRRITAKTYCDKITLADYCSYLDWYKKSFPQQWFLEFRAILGDKPEMQRVRIVTN